MKDFDGSRADADRMEWLGNTYRIMLSAGQTGGTLTAIETTTPSGSGPPRHVHAAEDEAFLILEGEAEFWVGGRSFRRGPGESAFVPRGTEHTFRALSDLRAILLLTPSGFENFFAEMAQGGYRIPEDMPAVAESAGRHNLAFTGPPL